MNYLDSLQKAIQFMEEHLLEPITVVEVANHVHMSTFHFHRTFSIITGVNVKEYIRNRRLSLAGQELLNKDVKVIDVAYTYQYESPESFTRAFVRFHGITPKMAKQYGHHLQLYNPLVIQISIQGGIRMKYRIEERKAFTLLVTKKQFPNTILEDPHNSDVSKFWDYCIEKDIFKELFKYATTPGTYGVCAPALKSASFFEYGIGVTTTAQDIPKAFTTWDIPATLWAVFTCKSKDQMDETWQRILTEFVPNSDYEIQDAADFEYYPETDEGYFCEIWVPIKKKS